MKGFLGSEGFIELSRVYRQATACVQMAIIADASVSYVCFWQFSSTRSANNGLGRR